MPMVATDNKHYKNIAKAIRLNSGKSELFKPEEMSAGIEQVYNKGKADFGYEKSVSGNYITIDDIHPNEKEIYTALTSNTVTDFSNTKLIVCGKNLFDSNKMLQCQGWKEEDGVYTGNPAYLYSKWGSKSVIDAFEPNTRYKIGFQGYNDSSYAANVPSLMVALYYTDGTVDMGISLRGTSLGYWEHTSRANKNLEKICLSYGTSGICYIKDFYIARASTLANYEPYTGAEYTPDADGNVNDITPCYPITNMFTNNIDVTINAEYYADSEKIIGELTDTIISLGGTI